MSDGTSTWRIGPQTVEPMPAGRSGTAARPSHETAVFRPGVHGARGLFALAVAVYHVFHSGLPVWPLPWPVFAGLSSLQFSVELFFAVSGFVIAGTLRRSRAPLDFLVGRATRIIPVLWAVLIVAIPIGYVAGNERYAMGSQPEFALVVVGNFLALGPLLPVPVLYGAAWTIGYEFVFYYLCFAYLLVLRTFRIDILWLVFAIGLVIIVIKPRAMYFLPGVAVAAGLLDRTIIDRLARFPFLFLLLFFGSWRAMANDETPFFDPIWEWNLTADAPLAIIAFLSATIVIQGLARGGSAFERVMRGPPFQWLGTISYSFYLWHPLVFGIVKSALGSIGFAAHAGQWSQLLFLCIVMPVALLIAQVSQRTLETRLTTALRRRWL